MTWDIFTVIHLHELCVHHPMRRGLGEHRRGWGVAESSTCIRNVSSIKFRTRGPPTVLVSRRKLTIIIWKTKLRRSPWRVVKMLRWAIFRMPPLWSSSRSLIWMFHICCPGHWKKIDGFLQVDLAHSLRENVKIFCKTKSTSVNKGFNMADQNTTIFLQICPFPTSPKQNPIPEFCFPLLWYEEFQNKAVLH